MKKLFDKFSPVFLAQNAKINLISKNDEAFLFEKHFFDSLALSSVFEKYGIPKTVLDIGTGGGFPAVPIAMKYPKIEVFALDSVAKKIRAIDEIKSQLELYNLHTICARAQSIDEVFDFVSARALARLDKLIELALPRLKKGGIFAAYKSQRAEEEIEQAKYAFKKYHGKIIDRISYTLPLQEPYQRELIVIKKLNT